MENEKISWEKSGKILENNTYSSYYLIIDIMEIVQTNSAPKACGAYSQAVRTENLVFTAGQIWLDPSSNTLIEGLEGQAHQVMKNIWAILESQWLSISDVVKTTIFLSDISNWWAVNEVYAEYFTHKPARSTVAVAGLPAGALLEIEVIAEIQ